MLTDLSAFPASIAERDQQGHKRAKGARGKESTRAKRLGGGSCAPNSAGASQGATCESLRMGGDGWRGRFESD